MSITVQAIANVEQKGARMTSYVQTLPSHPDRNVIEVSIQRDHLGDCTASHGRPRAWANLDRVAHRKGASYQGTKHRLILGSHQQGARHRLDVRVQPAHPAACGQAAARPLYRLLTARVSFGVHLFGGPGRLLTATRGARNAGPGAALGGT